jgi:hypothetical protein
MGRRAPHQQTLFTVGSDMATGSMVAPHFDGPELTVEDEARLARQQQAVGTFMADHGWHTLHEISDRTGAPEASVSARLRDLRKPRFGEHVIEKRRVEGHPGLWEYRLVS